MILKTLGNLSLITLNRSKSFFQLIVATLIFSSSFLLPHILAGDVSHDENTYIYVEDHWEAVMVFTENGVFETSEDIECRILAVGGGGGSGSSNSGGGGGGGVQDVRIIVPAGVYPITVGEGGIPGLSLGRGGNGGNSSFGNLVVSFGGGGGGGEIELPAQGGSGGGGNGYNNFAGAPGTEGQGHAGGTG
ncbi:MAG: hypothetical protein GX811_07165, partial [Lentisphaerae bacterium]|nr:hypothetical protein [Lentisphaerota bacterium]